MNRSESHPFSRKTPKGGKMTASMILQMSEAVKGIVEGGWKLEGT